MDDLKYNRSREVVERAAAGDDSDLYVAKDLRGVAARDGARLVWPADLSDAYLNAADLNRIEGATGTARARLLENGYAPDTESIRADWTRTAFPTREQLDRIRRNVDKLQASYYPLPGWRAIDFTETLDYNQSNAIEWDLHLLLLTIDGMVEAAELRQANSFAMEAGGIL